MFDRSARASTRVAADARTSAAIAIVASWLISLSPGAGAMSGTAASGCAACGDAGRTA